MRNKYGARRTFSELCGREFASKAECARGEELHLLEFHGDITGLEYQPKFRLCESPKITYTADFRYKWGGQVIVEDVKGVLTRDTRTRLAWLKEKHNVDVSLVMGTRL